MSAICLYSVLSCEQFTELIIFSIKFTIQQHSSSVRVLDHQYIDDYHVNYRGRSMAGNYYSASFLSLYILSKCLRTKFILFLLTYGLLSTLCYTSISWASHGKTCYHPSCAKPIQVTFFLPLPVIEL